MNERELFEQWARANTTVSLQRDPDAKDDYYRASAEGMWLAWQARAEQPSAQAQAQQAQGLTAIMEAVDDYADAFRAAIRPDGGIHFAEGIVAKGKKDMLRAVVERELRASTAAAPSPVPAGTNDALAGLVGWAQMLMAQPDLPPDLRSRFADNHRLTTAVLMLAATGATT
jgi:hypothetical protein